MKRYDDTYPIKRKSLVSEIFSENPLTDDYYYKFIDENTSPIYSSIEDDDPSTFFDKLREFRETSLADPDIKRRETDNDRGLSIFDNVENSGFTKFIGENFDKNNENKTGLFKSIKDKINIDEVSKSVFGEKGVGIGDNVMGAASGIIGAATSQVNSEGAATMQGASMAMKGAKLGTSIGGPLGGVIGGVGGLAFGLIDGKNDLKKIKEEKKRKYRQLLDEIKDARRRNYEASKGSNTNYNKF